MDYYFLATALPPLSLDTPPEFGFAAVMFVLQVNLTPADRMALRIFRRFYDVQNAKAVWLGHPLDTRGNLDVKALEEAQHSGVGIPEYVLDFLSRYDTIAQRLRHFPALQAAYFRDESAKARGFLRDYLVFEREWRLVVAVLRAKLLKRDVADALEGEDLYSDFVAQLLVQKDSPSFDPPEGYEVLKVIFDRHANDPLALHQAICAYRFDKIEGMLGVDLFSIDRILGYVAQLIIVEKWFELDRQKGIQVVDSIVKEKL